jgi:hypothetical protein
VHHALGLAIVAVTVAFVGIGTFTVAAASLRVDSAMPAASGGGSSNVGLIVLIVAALAAIGGTWWALFGKRRKDDEPKV